MSSSEHESERATNAASSAPPVKNEPVEGPTPVGRTEGSSSGSFSFGKLLGSLPIISQLKGGKEKSSRELPSSSGKVRQQTRKGDGTAIAMEYKPEKKRTGIFSRQRKTSAAKPGVIVKKVRGAQYPPPAFTAVEGADQYRPEADGSKAPGEAEAAPAAEAPEKADPGTPSSVVSSVDTPLGHARPPMIQRRMGSDLSISSQKSARIEKFKQMFDKEQTDLSELRQHTWNGVPGEYRAVAWQMLTGYLPGNKERRQATLQRKRQEYKALIQQYYQPEHLQGEYQQTMWRQIHIDVPRTNPDIKLFQCPAVQTSLERLLYLWAIRHPASGYVQGINDLATPFLTVFLFHNSDCRDLDALEDADDFDAGDFEPDVMERAEADTFWCLTNFLESIQDNYTFAAPGIQKMVHRLREIVQRVDANLARHLETEGLQFIQFAFRWMNCLLMRELPLRLVIRLWDTYLSEGENFAVLHLYVCAAFLVCWSDKLQQLEFMDLVLFLQHLPTSKWGVRDVEMLVSQAWQWKMLFHEAQQHLRMDSPAS